MLQKDLAGGLRRVDADAVCGEAVCVSEPGVRPPRSGRLCGHLAGERRWQAAPSVMMAEVEWFCLNSSAAYLSTAVNGAPSGTLSLPAHRSKRVRKG